MRELIATRGQAASGSATDSTPAHLFRLCDGALAHGDGGGNIDVERLRFLIVGTPRSGTTLVQRLACELPGVKVPPETQFLWSFAPDLLRRSKFPLDEDAIRGELELFADRELATGLQVDPDVIVELLGGRCPTPFHLFAAMVEQLAGPADLYGEKSPHNLVVGRRLALEMPHLKIVAVVRDPRATVRSNLEVPWDLARPWAPRSAAVLAHRWVLDQKELLRTRSALGDRCLLLRYEDVVGDPDAARYRLATFFGLSASRDQLDDAPRPAASDFLLPQETWKANVFGPIEADRNSSWRSALTEDQVADIVAICRRLMLRFGYQEGLPSRTGAALRLTLLSWKQKRALIRHKAFRSKEGLLADRAVPQFVSPRS